MADSKNYRFETLQLHVGQEQADPATDSRAVPIYQTTSYVFHNFDHAEARFGLADPGNIYGRLTNSTQGVFEDRIAALEGGAAGLAVASGAAAVEYAVRNITQSGDHIVAAKNIYGGTFNLLRHTLPRDGITTTFVSAENPQEFEDAIQENTKLVYFETFGNPNADLPDFEAITAIAHKHHLPVIVDNTFATPYLFRPLEHGADVVVESATKFIGGHGTTLGGVIVEGGNFNWAEVPGKFPTLTEPDPSYHGLNFYEALGGSAFVTRIRAILRRTMGSEEDDAFLRVGDLVIDEDAHEVTRAGIQIDLSPTEFKLLRYLVINAGRVVSKMQILDHVWEYDWDGEVAIVESYISYLRRKLAVEGASGELIHTKRGVGYILRAEE